VDVTISYNDGIIFIEAKYLAPVSLKTTHDRHRDQVIRYLDLAAYHYLNSTQGPITQFYLILITDLDDPPWILSRYRSPGNLAKGLTDPGFIGKNRNDVSKLLADSIGWTSWGKIKDILKLTRENFRAEAEKRFVDDLVFYLEYKIKEAVRIRNERNQMNFW